MNVFNVFGPVLVSKLNGGDRPVVMEFKSLRIVFLLFILKSRLIKVLSPKISELSGGCYSCKLITIHSSFCLFWEFKMPLPMVFAVNFNPGLNSFQE